MTYTSEELINEIKDLLFGLEREIEYDNKAGNFDVNTYAEDFYKELLNIMHPKWELINLNTIQANYPAIDLGDSLNKIGIQITSDSSPSKINDTLETFYRNSLEKDYSTLYIVYIKGKKKTANHRIKNNGQLSFNKSKHIIDNTDILNWIKQDCNITQLQKIVHFIKSYVRKKTDLFSKIILPFYREVNNLKKFKNLKLSLLQITNFHTRKEHWKEDLQVLSSTAKDQKIDIVILNGNFTNNLHSYSSFKEEIIPEICKTLSISPEKIIFSLGENEIDLSAKIPEWLEKAIREQVSGSQDQVSTYIKESIQSNNFNGLEKIEPFKKFEQEYHKDSETELISTFFHSSYIINIENIKIGITCLNPFLNYFKDNRHNNQVLGKEQILLGLNDIHNADIKIGVSFLPLDFLKKFDENDSRELLKNFNLFFIGGEKESNYLSKFSQNTFILAPTVSKIEQPKFQILTYIPFEKSLEINEFFVNQQANNLEKRSKRVAFPTKEDLEYQSKNKEYLKNISTYFIENIDKNLINYGTDSSAPNNLNKLFVTPLISNQPFDKEDKSTINFSINQLISSSKNYLILGRRESGKSILLNKILIEYYKRYDRISKIPLLIDFNDLKKDSIINTISKIIADKKSEIESRLNNGALVLLIDNLSFDEESKSTLRKINCFLQKYPDTKLFATSVRPSSLYITPEYYEEVESCNFNTLHIRDFGTKQIKDLTKKWFSNISLEQQPKYEIEKIVQSFNAFGLPSTPMAISLYLWIIEKQERKPINNAILLKCFIDNLLDKANKSQVYRDKFDASNKVNLIADIAHFMYERNNSNYAIEYGELISFTHKYLIEKGFNSEKHKIFNSKTILDNLIDRGILVAKNDFIKFRFECFFNYFLAQKMILDIKFKDNVFLEENYQSFTNEIDYYTGLLRNQEDVLKIIFKRLKKSFSEINSKKSKLEIAKDIDLIFKESESITTKFSISDVLSNKPSSEDIEKVHDKSLESNEVRTNIKKKNAGSPTNKNSFEIIKLAGNVLRNSEEVKNNKLKTEVYHEIIRNSAIFMCLEKIKLIHFFNEYGKIPDFIPWNISLKGLLKLLPLITQISIYDFLGSQKIASLIYDKIILDQTDQEVSKMEQFLSVFIYSDIKAPKSKEVLKEYVYSKGKNHAVRDLAFLKILSYFYLRSSPQSKEEKHYLDLILELKSNHNQQTKTIMAGKLAQDLRFKKRKKDL